MKLDAKALEIFVWAFIHGELRQTEERVKFAGDLDTAEVKARPCRFKQVSVDCGN